MQPFCLEQRLHKWERFATSIRITLLRDWDVGIETRIVGTVDCWVRGGLQVKEGEEGDVDESEGRERAMFLTKSEGCAAEPGCMLLR